MMPMDAASATLTLDVVFVMVCGAVTWAASIAGVYFGLKGRVASGESRMDRFRGDLDRGNARFSEFEGRFKALEERQAHHGERLVVVETLLSTMNDKLDNILVEVRHK